MFEHRFDTHAALRHLDEARRFGSHEIGSSSLFARPVGHV